jgi:membrane protein
MGSTSALEGILHRPLAGSLPSLAEIADGFKRSELAIRASSISFRLLYALIPFALFALALAGALSLDSLWNVHLAPDIGSRVSPSVYDVLNTTVQRVLSGRQVFWVTVGALLVLWETSSAVRAVMAALDAIYDSARRRSTLERFRRSFWLAPACSACVLATGVVVQLGPLVADGVLATIARYLLAAALLWCTVTLLVRFAPAEPQPLGWVSFGSTLVILGWLVTWSAYGVYLTKVTDAGSAFGALAAIIILLAFLQLSNIVLLTGALVDALIRERVTGDPQGK